MNKSDLRKIDSLIEVDSYNSRTPTRRFDLQRVPVYLRVISIVVSLFIDVFTKDGRVKIRFWDIVSNIGRIRTAFLAVKDEFDNLKE